MQFLTNLFKSRATKETERFKAEAEMERLKDAVETVIAHVTYKLNDFCRETGFKIGSERLSAYKDAMQKIECSDIDSKIEIFNQLALRFVQDMDAFSAEMCILAEKSLGDLKYTLIEMGLRDEFKRLIQLKVSQLSSLLIEDGANDARNQYARLMGILHDNGTIMTEEEVRAKYRTA